MPDTVICTICSRSKNEGGGKMPASERYTGRHIKTVKEIAHQKKSPLFFLSGEFGFISEKEMIPNYDHLLVSSEVDALVTMIKPQLARYKVKNLYFYYKENAPDWLPYETAIAQAADDLGIHLLLRPLQE